MSIELQAILTGLTADTTPDTAADYLLSYDASADALKKVPMNLVGGAGGGLTTGNPVVGGAASRLLYEDDSQELAASDLFFLNDTNGVIAVCHPGTGSSCGFFIMPNGSVKSDTENGPWLGGMIYGGIGGPGVGLFGDSGEPEFYIKSSSFIDATIPLSNFVFGRGGVINTVRLTVCGLTDDQTSYALAILDKSRARNIFLVRSDGSVTFDNTVTATGTTGNQTIHKPSGKVNIAAGGSSITVFNNLCQGNSIVLATVLSNDSTAYIKNVVPGTNNFVIHLGAAATAETPIGFLVINL